MQKALHCSQAVVGEAKDLHIRRPAEVGHWALHLIVVGNQTLQSTHLRHSHSTERILVNENI
jgi:hypothetical protein